MGENAYITRLARFLPDRPHANEWEAFFNSLGVREARELFLMVPESTRFSYRYAPLTVAEN